MTLPPNTPLSAENVECDTCEGSGKIVEAARTHGANQHSACQMDCEDCDGTGRRPALSPPAEGETMREGYNRVEAIREAAEGQDRLARGTSDPIAKSEHETQAAGHWDRYEREVTKLNATPTPAPADHIGDATEKVDWERVGPKLVEALETIAAAKRQGVKTPMTYAGGFDAGCDWASGVAERALAATQPQSNGE